MFQNFTAATNPDDGPPRLAALRAAIKRLGEPVIRTAVGRAMKEMGRQFVLGETITNAELRTQPPTPKTSFRLRGVELYGYTPDAGLPLGFLPATPQDAA